MISPEEIREAEQELEEENDVHNKEMDNCNCSGGLLHTRPSFFSK